MFCSNCGKPMVDNARYCSSCGTSRHSSINMIDLACPGCNSQLSMSRDHLMLYCPYCQRKLALDFDGVDKVLVEKEKTNRVKLDNEYKLEDKKLTYEHEHRENLTTNKLAIVSVIFSLIVIVGLWGWIIGERYHEQKIHDDRIEVLEQLELELQRAISDGDFDTALMRANQLILSDDESQSDRELWDQKRESYIQLIHQKQEEQIRNDPNMVFLPFSYSSLNGKPYAGVVEQFHSLGFTDITVMITDKTAGWFTADGTVEHISIGGHTSFSEDDSFSKSTPVVIYYYQK